VLSANDEDDDVTAAAAAAAAGCTDAVVPGSDAEVLLV